MNQSREDVRTIFVADHDAAKPLKPCVGVLHDPTTTYYLGMAQYGLKETAESKRSLQRALDLNVSGDLDGEARRSLAELK